MRYQIQLETHVDNELVGVGIYCQNLEPLEFMSIEVAYEVADSLSRNMGNVSIHTRVIPSKMIRRITA